MQPLKRPVINQVFARGTAWFMLLLVPITFVGFYPTYYSKLSYPHPPIVHLHGLLMVVWLALVVTQPLLIRYNRFSAHRLTGKLSYFVMPLILVSGYFILRYSYQRALQGEDVGPPGFYPADLPLEIKAAEFVVIGTVYWVWLIVYYILGVSFRKNVVSHATFMLAAALTILGPAGDRLIGYICDAFGWPFNAIAGNFVFALVVIVFSFLFVLHLRRKLSVWPSLLVIVLQLTGIFFFYNMPFHPAWTWLAAVLFG
ncbi:MAG: hypothetical protein L6Q51_03410 [Cyclobacteriaceae bacterium]|nr:hypothetical protein [Cyclobacteriaceae bacterium]